MERGRRGGLALAPPPPSISRELPPLPPPIKKEKMKFPCVHCRKQLKIRMVRKRTKVRCPRCREDFYVFPDGRVEDCQPKIAVAIPVESPKKRISKKRTQRSRRKATARLEDNEILPTAKPRRKSKPKRSTNMFESVDFDPADTGFNFEAVTSLEGSNLDELRAAAGLDEQLDDAGYTILLDSMDQAPPLRSRKKRHRKKRRKKTEGFVILQGSEDVARRREGRRSGNHRTVKRLSRDALSIPGGAGRRKTGRSRQQSEGISRNTGRVAQQRSTGRAPRQRSTGRSQQRSATRRRESLESNRRRTTPDVHPFHELSGETRVELEAASTTSKFLHALLIIIPLLILCVFLLSTTRDRGFATKGFLGQSLEELGQSVQGAVQELRSK